jgi:hypothetical protein
MQAASDATTTSPSTASTSTNEQTPPEKKVARNDIDTKDEVLTNSRANVITVCVHLSVCGYLHLNKLINIQTLLMFEWITYWVTDFVTPLPHKIIAKCHILCFNRNGAKRLHKNIKKT